MANIQRVSDITRNDTWELMLDLEVWPESRWPRFLLIKGDGLQSYTA